MSDLRTIGRATQGVRLIKISGNDEISSVAKVAAEEKEEDAVGQPALVEANGVDIIDGSHHIVGLAIGSDAFDEEDNRSISETDDVDDDSETDETEDSEVLA